MKDMKLRDKFIISFLIIIVLTAIVGIAGIFGMKRISDADENMYNMNTLAIIELGKIKENIQEQRNYSRNFIIYNSGDSAFKSAVDKMTNAETTILTYFAEYEKTMTLGEDKEKFSKFKNAYLNGYAQVKSNIHSYGAVDDTEGARNALTAGAGVIDEMVDLLEEVFKLNLDEIENTVAENKGVYLGGAIMVAFVLVTASVIAILMALYLMLVIGKPVRIVSEEMSKLSQTGDFDIESVNSNYIKESIVRRDEIGDLAKSFETLLSSIQSKITTLKIIAKGDLTPDIVRASNNDSIGNALKEMTDNLNDMFDEIKSSTAQVSIGSTQIAEGAQSLAQGSTEQASAVEQLSSSITDVADKTRENASKADTAMNLANVIKDNAQTSSDQMGQMMQAVKEINDASQSINKVIKVIDDIAFQTNILALNAAVEAARAGQHGKGFAVVAEEVRNLAAKSAEAAKDTSSMIVNSIEKADLGSRIADETSKSLIKIVGEINEIAVIIEDVAKSSDEQSHAIIQINKGIDQVAQVVQQNSATAQQSAASSEEMSGQASILEELINRFKIKSSSGSGISSRTSSFDRTMKGQNLQKPKIELLGDVDYGKY